jgi:ribosomal-protein-alanine N-acetyltransferase
MMEAQLNGTLHIPGRDVPDKVCIVNFGIRAMTPADVKKVAEIEGRVFPVPWSENSMDSFMLHGRNCGSVVCEHGSDIMGYAFYWIVVDELHIANIAVDSPYRRRGIGNTIMRHMMLEAQKKGAAYAFLEVRESNVSAITLYTKLGFSIGGRRNNYYSDTSEDAVTMIKLFKKKESSGLV